MRVGKMLRRAFEPPDIVVAFPGEQEVVKVSSGSCAAENGVGTCSTFTNTPEFYER